jgi:hypothetical protein
LVKGLDLPTPFSAYAFSECLARQRGRRMYIHPLPYGWAGEGTPCGIWMATDVADHVFFEAQTSSFHQEHIILHELGHMICGHAIPLLADELNDGLDLGTVDQTVIRRALLRTSYHTEQEREAELLATMLRERVARRKTPADDRGRWLSSAFGLSDDS